MGYLGKITGKVFNYVGRKASSLGARFEAKGATAKGVESTVVNRKPAGPTLSEIISRQPKALPAPSAEQLAASKPVLSTAKLTGYGVEQLDMTQVITKDGTHIRYYRYPGKDRVVFQTNTKGALRQEYAPRANGDFTYLKSIGDEKYLVQKKGDETIINKRTMVYDRGKRQQVGEDVLVDNKYRGNFFIRHLKGVNGYDRTGGAVYHKAFYGEKPLKTLFEIKNGSKSRLMVPDNITLRDSIADQVKDYGFNVDPSGHLLNYTPDDINIIDDLLKPYKA